jgi:hypothetical protein
MELGSFVGGQQDAPAEELPEFPHSPLAGRTSEAVAPAIPREKPSVACVAAA